MHQPGPDPMASFGTDQGTNSLLFTMSLFLLRVPCPLCLVQNGHQPEKGGGVGEAGGFPSLGPRRGRSRRIRVPAWEVGWVGKGMADRTRNPCKAFVSASVLHSAFSSGSGPDVLTLRLCGSGLND